MFFRDLEIYDKRTGEKLDGLPTLCRSRQWNGFGDRWLAMSMDAALEIALDERIQGQDLRVFLVLLSKLDYENWLRVCQADLAAALGMHKGHVSRSIKRLLDAEILLEGPKVGTSKTYRLNPAYGWRGSAKKHREALRDRLEVIQGGKDQEPAS
jgi:DNA-binding transcriptional ArsR family regulator